MAKKSNILKSKACIRMDTVVVIRVVIFGKRNKNKIKADFQFAYRCLFVHTGPFKKTTEYFDIERLIQYTLKEDKGNTK